MPQTILLMILLEVYFSDNVEGDDDNRMMKLCIYAQTSQDDNAGSDAVEKTVVTYTYLINQKPKETAYQVFSLYDTKGNDMHWGHGTLWEFEVEAKAKGPYQFDEMVISTTDKDKWIIETAMVIATNDTEWKTLYLFTHDYHIDGTVEHQSVELDKRVSLGVNTVEYDNCAAAKQCISRVIFVAYTGDNGAKGGDCDMQMKSGETTKKVNLYNIPNISDKEHYSGDLWDFEISRFGFEESCVTFDSINEISFVATSKDDWLVTDVFVTVELDQSGDFILLAGDKNFMTTVSKDKISVAPITLRNKC